MIIQWIPSLDVTVTEYLLRKATTENGLFTDIITVSNTLSSNPNYSNGIFFYNDVDGSPTDFYRLFCVTATKTFGPSRAFQSIITPPILNGTLNIDHNYGEIGTLRYQAANGMPVENAVIRVYTKENFDQGLTSNPVAITATDSLGNWIEPINLQTGQSYIIQFHKPGLYGPDITEIDI